MIGAAKAGGQIDGTGSKRIFTTSVLSASTTGARAVAASADSREEAAEIYAVSVMAVNPNGLAELLYLGDLSGLLKLEPALAKTIREGIHPS